MIKKGILHFLIAKLVYLQGALWKKQLIASFLEHFKWKSRIKFEAYFFSLIFLDLIRKKVTYLVFLAVMLNLVACGRDTLWRELFITKISSREILEKSVIVLIRLTFLFLSFFIIFQRCNFSIIYGHKTRSNNTSTNQVPKCYITVEITTLYEIKSLSSQKEMC